MRVLTGQPWITDGGRIELDRCRRCLGRLTTRLLSQGEFDEDQNLLVRVHGPHVFDRLRAGATTGTAGRRLPPCEAVNVLTDAEKAAGWKLLFDGESKAAGTGTTGRARSRGRWRDCALKSVGNRGQLRQRQARRPRHRPRSTRLRAQLRLEGLEGRQQRRDVRRRGGPEVQTRPGRPVRSTSSSTTSDSPRSWRTGRKPAPTTPCTCRPARRC